MTGSEETNLAIDLKYYRMRISRATLQGIGSPRFIQFLVNPMKKEIAIRSATKMSAPDQTCRVDWERHQNRSYIEVKSKLFLHTLCSEMAGMSEGKSYRLRGLMVPAEEMVVFSLADHRSLERSVQQ